MRRMLVTAIWLLCFLPAVKSQSVQNIVYGIYSKYDSLGSLTFDVKYTYTSDTVHGDFIYDVLEGNYTMNGKKAVFKLGDIEYLQNDSFFLAVYNQDNIIMVTDPKQTNSGNFLPLREDLDSLMLAYASHYNISNSENDSTGNITFTKIAGDSLARFKSFVIEYDSQRRLLLSLNYVFDEMVPVDPDNSTDMVLRTKRLKIEFLNYRFDNFSDEIYDENNYIFLEAGVWKPITKYANFKVYYSRTGFVRENLPQ